MPGYGWMDVGKNSLRYTNTPQMGSMSSGPGLIGGTVGRLTGLGRAPNRPRLDFGTPQPQHPPITPHAPGTLPTQQQPGMAAGASAAAAGGRAAAPPAAAPAGGLVSNPGFRAYDAASTVGFLGAGGGIPSTVGIPFTRYNWRVPGVGMLRQAVPAAYGGYALADLGRSTADLATGNQTFEGIQQQGVERMADGGWGQGVLPSMGAYADAVNHNLARPGEATYGLVSSIPATISTLVGNSGRAARLDPQIAAAQAARQQTTQQAMANGTATRQQLADARAAALAERQAIDSGWFSW